MTPPELNETEQLLLATIPAGGCEGRYIRVPGISPQKRTKLLYTLEEMGLVGRYANAYGPQEPWWWMRLPTAPSAPFEPPLTDKGTVYDGYDPNGRPRVHFECDGHVNEHGCAGGYLKAGEHNSFHTWLPLHLLAREWSKRRRGEVTTWSAHFHCPIHGECTLDMVKTDKCCALCGSGLNRV